MTPSSETANQAREIDELLSEILDHFRVRDEREIRDRRMAWSEYRALCLAAGSESPPGMQAVARHLGLTKGGATRLVDRLERKGLLLRQGDPDDRRRTVIETTERGGEVLEDLQESLLAERRALVGRMGPAAREEVLGALRTLRQALASHAG